MKTSNPDKALCVIDLDDTLIRKNSSVQFYFYLLERKVLPRRSLVKVFFYQCAKKCGLFSLDKFHQKIFHAFLKGKSRKEIEGHAKDFVDRGLARFFCPRIISYLQKAQAKKHTTVLLSTSPAFLVKHFAKKLDLSYCYGSTYNSDEQQRFASIASTVDGRKKCEIVCDLCSKLSFDIHSVYACSDSSQDLPLLNLVSPRVSVIRPDLFLRLVAYKKRWPIL